MGVAAVGQSRRRGRLRGLPTPPQGAPTGSRRAELPEQRRLAALAGRDQDRERAPAAVAGEVDLRAEAAPPAPQSLVVVRVRCPPFAPRPLGLRRAPAACWWARTTAEESTLTSHSIPPTASGMVCARASKRSQVPSSEASQREKRS